MHWFSLAVWLLAGFCGTVLSSRRMLPIPVGIPAIRIPPIPEPETPPRPDEELLFGPHPHPWLVAVVGALSGLAGGWAAYRFGIPGAEGPLTLGQTLATATVGLALSVVASGVVSGGWDPSAPQRRGASFR